MNRLVFDDPHIGDSLHLRVGALLSLDGVALGIAKKRTVRGTENLMKELDADFPRMLQEPGAIHSRNLKRVEEKLWGLFSAEADVRVKKRTSDADTSKRWVSSASSASGKSGSN